MKSFFPLIVSIALLLGVILSLSLRAIAQANAEARLDHAEMQR